MLQLFGYGQVVYGNKRVRAVTITCGKCSREEKHHVNTLGHGSGCDDDQLAALFTKKFEALGWRVGKSLSRHRCPSCIKDARAAQMRFVHGGGQANKQKAGSASPPKKEEPVSAKVIVPEGFQLKPEPAHVEAPREMARQDRRVIFAKLEEVYADEATGYHASWTDQRVADDLGAPVAWVRQVRDENFGPLATNPEIDRLMLDARQWRSELVIMLERQEQLLLGIKQLTSRGEVIERRLTEVLKSVGK